MLFQESKNMFTLYWKMPNSGLLHFFDQLPDWFRAISRAYHANRGPFMIFINEMMLDISQKTFCKKRNQWRCLKYRRSLDFPIPDVFSNVCSPKPDGFAQIAKVIAFNILRQILHRNFTFPSGSLIFCFPFSITVSLFLEFSVLRHSHSCPYLEVLKNKLSIHFLEPHELFKIVLGSWLVFRCW